MPFPAAGPLLAVLTAGRQVVATPEVHGKMEVEQAFAFSIGEVGRGGGDRKQRRLESQGLTRNAKEC